MADIIVNDSTYGRFAAKTRLDTATGCLEWTGSTNRLGYGRMRVGGHCREAHRVAWVLAHGQIPLGLDVLHSCDNRACVNVAHLWLGTHADNMADMVAKGRGRGLRGELNGHSRLTEHIVRDIRASKKAGIPYRTIAANLGIPAGTVHNVVKFKSWAHVT